MGDGIKKSNHAHPRNGNATAQRVAGLVAWKGLGDAAAAVAHLEAGPLHDPIAVMELDELYSELGLQDRRVALLSSAPQHPRILERHADLALNLGKPSETIQIALGCELATRTPALRPDGTLAQGAGVVGRPGIARASDVE